MRNFLIVIGIIVLIIIIAVVYHFSTTTKINTNLGSVRVAKPTKSQIKAYQAESDVLTMDELGKILDLSKFRIV